MEKRYLVENKDLMKEWDWDFNKNLNPAELIVGSHKQVWWKCSKCGYRWQAEVRRRVQEKTQCPSCSGRAVKQGYNDLVTKNPDIAKEWNYERNFELMPYQFKSRSNEKVWWKCSKCGYEWKTSISHRTGKNGTGCPKCGIEKSKIPKQKAVNMYDPNTKETRHFVSVSEAARYIKSSTSNISVACLKCRMTAGYYWYYDGIDFVPPPVKKVKYLIDYEILMQEWDWEANIGLDPAKLSVGSNKKVHWKCCKCGHKWIASIYGRAVCNHGCHNCHWMSRLNVKNNITKTHPEMAKDWDVRKNGDLIPDMFTKGARYNAFWRCSKCGYEWRQPIGKFNGCKVCKKDEYLSENSLAAKCPELTKEWHPIKNGDLTPNDVSYVSNQRVWWKCSKCGYEYQSKISNKAFLKRNCPCCSNRIAVHGINDLETTHPEIAKEWHPTKNGNLCPNKVTYGCNKKVWWVCPNGHEYQATVNHRTGADMTQCPICYSGRQTSFAEQAFYFYIKNIYPDAVNRYKADFLDKMELDIYIPSIHVAIEYDGEAWHKKEKASREQKKYKICKEHQIYLIRLKEKDYGIQDNADSCYVFQNLYLSKNLNRMIPCILNQIDCTTLDILASGKITSVKAYDVDVNRDRIEILSMFSTQQQKKSFGDIYPEIAKEWHPTKNGNLTPNMFKIHSDHKVWWKCSKCGYEYEATIGHRSYGCGCIKCGIQKSKSKSVLMLDPVTNKIIRKFKSITEAGRVIDINTSNISMVCKGIRPKAGGYKWCYEEDYFNGAVQLSFDF